MKKKAKKKDSQRSKHPSGSVRRTPSTIGVEPLGDRVLIKPLSPEELGETTSFGIIIPDTITKEKSDRGVVVAVGSGRKNDKGERVGLEVEVGDRVLYTKPWGDPVKIRGAEYFLVSESEILAIIK